MSASKEESCDVSDEVHEATSSDQSLCGSWTVLDSSHLNEDGDLSDAESVEVLATEGQCVENVTEDEPEEASPFDASSASFINDEPVTFPLQEPIGVSSLDGAPDGDSEWLTDNEDSTPQDRDNNEHSPTLLKKFWHVLWQTEHVEICIPHFLVDMFWFSLLFDVLIVSYFGVSTLAGMLEAQLYGGMKTLKPHQQYAHQQYEMDPLVLQLSHVVAEWKKYPLEDHSLDRHMLKTLFLYYGGSTELSANLHALTEKVQKHNELLRRVGKEVDETEDGYHQLTVSGHLAHSVACIIGKQDQRMVPPEIFFMSNNTNDKSSNFAPEPGFWLNDWHLPQYFKANDTYYRIDSRPVFSPMRNFFPNLGSAKWNEYFWRLYHDANDHNNNIDEKGSTENYAEKVSSSELDNEETERSPLDGTFSVDLPSVEESSGSASESETNADEQLLFPLFVSDLGTEEEPTEAHSKLEAIGNYFEILDGEDFLDNPSNYECLDDGCRPYKEQAINQEGKAAKWLERGKLIQLYEEAALQETENDNQINAISHENFLPQEQKGRFEASSSSILKHKGGLSDSFGKSLSGGKLGKLFEEAGLQESQSDEADADVIVEVLDDQGVGGVSGADTVARYELKDELFFNDSQEEKELKPKDAKKKQRMNKSKLKKKGKEKKSYDKADSDDKKKRKRKGHKKEPKVEDKDIWSDVSSPEDEVIWEKSSGKKKTREEHIADWNTRMAKGREELRALNKEGDDQMWVFERAKARRGMREESFSQRFYPNDYT